MHRHGHGDDPGARRLLGIEGLDGHVHDAGRVAPRLEERRRPGDGERLVAQLVARDQEDPPRALASLLLYASRPTPSAPWPRAPRSTAAVGCVAGARALGYAEPDALSRALARKGIHMPAPDPPGPILRDEMLPALGRTAFTVDRGQTVRVVDVDGQQVADFVCFRRPDTSEKSRCTTRLSSRGRSTSAPGTSSCPTGAAP